MLKGARHLLAVLEHNVSCRTHPATAPAGPQGHKDTKERLSRMPFKPWPHLPPPHEESTAPAGTPFPSSSSQEQSASRPSTAGVCTMQAGECLASGLGPDLPSQEVPHEDVVHHPCLGPHCDTQVVRTPCPGGTGSHRPSRPWRPTTTPAATPTPRCPPVYCCCRCCCWWCCCSLDARAHSREARPSLLCCQAPFWWRDRGRDAGKGQDETWQGLRAERPLLVSAEAREDAEQGAPLRPRPPPCCPLSVSAAVLSLPTAPFRPRGLRLGARP